MRSGTFHDCLQDYLKTIDLSQRKRLAQFIGCTEPAIGNWMRQSALPVGGNALRLFCLMEATGFSITNWKVTNPDVLTVGRCVAFQVLTSDQVAAKLANPNLGGVIAIQMLVGNLHIKKQNLNAMSALATEYGPLVDNARASWQDLMALDDKTRAINELANRLKEILPLAENLVSDQYSGAERHELRKLSGETTMFRLYNAFGALCGERAREHVIHSARTSLA
jgi:hypothetical protein